MHRIAPMLIAATVLVAGSALATPGSGGSGAILGAGVIAGPINDKTHFEDGWVQLKAKGDVKAIVQRAEIAVDGHTGWHSHPAPHVVTVVQGEMTTYDAACQPMVLAPGTGFYGSAGQVHLARSTGSVPLVFLVTYLAAPDQSATALRTDEADPGCS